AVREVLSGSTIRLGAQNVHWKDEGAFTGEISPLMLRELCEYVIIGHSERRQYFGETDETVNKKVKSALAHGLTPIICVGENLAENEAGLTGDVVTRHV
ncbi:MAG: triose-phosphate isomerase, partial [Chloroflexaceae bacterium]|nr:triose-phosphate isomerase [Chloroflexaceae bacterium]